MNNNNITAEFVQLTSKKTGQPFEALQFSVATDGGVYKSSLSFPSNLEKELVKKAISKVGAIYG